MTIEATQRSLEERLGEALLPHRDPDRPRDNYAATDTLHGGDEPAPGGDRGRHAGAGAPQPSRKARACAGEYLHAARELEHTLALIKGRLYGAGARDSSGLAELCGRRRQRSAQRAQPGSNARWWRADRARRPCGGRRDWHGTCSTPRPMARPGHIRARRTPACSALWPAGSGRWLTGSGTTPRVASSPKLVHPAPPPTRQPRWPSTSWPTRKFDAAAPIVEHHHRHRHLRKTG